MLSKGSEISIDDDTAEEMEVQIRILRVGGHGFRWTVAVIRKSAWTQSRWKNDL